MIDQIPVENCIGCHACESICKSNAIQMGKNDEGFLYPSLNKDNCIQCEACLVVCPALAEIHFERFAQPTVYAAWSQDNTTRETSSSGGIFSELSLAVLGSEGVVYGAAFDKNLTLCHRRINSEGSLLPLKGSKYIQSSLTGIFTDVRKQLKRGIEVLFVGTPCQVAGLNNFLQKDYPLLLTCDVICHGVPSPGVFEKYIHELEQNHGAQVTNIQFRTKPQGWREFFVDIQFDNGTNIQEYFAQNLYMKGFLADIFLRPSCYQCKFSRIPRVADITLGDFWGIWDFRPKWDNDAGVTALLLNSTKAEKIIPRLDNIELKPAELNWVTDGNSSLTGSVTPHRSRKQFFRLYKKNRPFTDIVNRCMAPPRFIDKISNRLSNGLAFLWKTSNSLTKKI